MDDIGAIHVHYTQDTCFGFVNPKNVIFRHFYENLRRIATFQLYGPKCVHMYIVSDTSRIFCEKRPIGKESLQKI